MTQLTSLRTFLVAIALAGTGSAALAGTGSAALARDMVAINRHEVNMRSEAGTQYQALWVPGRGYPLQVLRRQGPWLKVRDFENDQHRVARSLTSSKTPHHVVQVHTLNIHSRPSTSSRILGKSTQGEILATQGRKGNWLKVQQDGGISGGAPRRMVWGW